jgi:hypothetical protein
VPLGVSRHFVKQQNMGSPPTHTVDAALRNGAWPRNVTAQLLHYVGTTGFLVMALL